MCLQTSVLDTCLCYIEIERQTPFYTKNNKRAIYYKSSNSLSYTV